MQIRGRSTPVGESTHADPDSLEHTVAGQLVHDEWGLHLAGLLVGVGHQATHKVGLTVVLGEKKKEFNVFGQKHQKKPTRVDISSVRLTR